MPSTLVNDQVNDTAVALLYGPFNEHNDEVYISNRNATRVNI